MQQATFIEIQGIGDANVLAIARYHHLLGLTKKACVELILSAPSIFKTTLAKAEADQLSSTLNEVGLPCQVVDPVSEYEHVSQLNSRTSDKFEIAAYIHDFSNITEFAGKVAAFTGQNGSDIVKSLCKTPATLLGQLSERVAQELASRFSMPGIDVLVSCPQKAQYTLVAYAMEDMPSVQQYYAQLGMSRQTNPQGLTQWQAQGIDFKKAHDAWHKASEAHLPIVLQNHDYMRFDVSLTDVSDNTDVTKSGSKLQEVLTKQCHIPKNIYQKLLTRLPIVIAPCQDWANTEILLAALQNCGARAEASLLSTNRFDLYFSEWKHEYQRLLTPLCNTFLGKASMLPDTPSTTCLLPINANLHQAKWLKHECDLMQINCQLRRR